VKKLYVIDGPIKGKSFKLNDAITTIGRASDNEICISDIGVSWQHAKFLKRNGRVFIVDLNSSQGVFIDGDKIEPGLEVEIKKESILHIGNTILSFQKRSSEKKIAKLYHTNSQRKLLDKRETLFVKDSSRNYIRSLELLLKVSNIFAQSLNIDGLLGEVIDWVFNLLRRIDRGAILLLDKETGKLKEMVSKTRMEDKDGPFSKINYNKAAVKRTIEEGKPVMMSDPGPVNEVDLSDSMEQTNVRSVMCVPLKYKGAVRGVIYVDSIGMPEGFRKDDLQLLTGLSNTAAIAIENARLYSGLEKVVERRTKQLEKARDVTEKRHMEAELTHTKNFLQNILDSSIDGITATDLQGRVISATPSMKDITGYDHREIIGKKVNIFDAQGVEDEKRIMRELMAQGELRNHEMKFKKKDGGLVNVNISASLLKNEQGEIIGTLGIYRDITEKKKLEAQVLQSHKMEAIGTLAGGIAHDFNNLLMGIQGHTSLMLLDIGPTHPYYERLKGVEQQVESGAELTKLLLSFARGGKYEVTATNINDLIEKSSTMFARARKEIKIYGKYEKDLWTVEADQGQIEQVLLNLYVNAWQAMPGSGELYLETENVTLDTNYVEPYHVEPGKYVKISVKDTGLGMDKETQQRVFDPFFTTKEMGRGTGLGLASVYGIIKNHGGIINVSSEKGKGTTFTIYLPASRKEITEEKELTHEVSRGKETVFLIDDEDTIIAVGQEIIKALGYTVLVARSGKEAIEIYEKNKDKIDIVILDMIMPDMSGGETYDRIKEINPDIKVLLSSGYSIDGEAKEILERGCDGFLQKPFNMKELSQKIREVLDKR